MRNRFAIMQGRLVPDEKGAIQSFPRRRWRDEFGFAAEAGLGAIEWIFDTYGEDVNPLSTDEGVGELLRLQDSSGVAVRSVCADWFMDHPLGRGSDAERDERSRKLDWLLGQCAKLSIERVVLPFVDSSRIEPEMEADVIAAIERALPAAGAAGIELHLETSFDPRRFRDFIAQLPAGKVFVNYDSGNSSGLGFDCAEEFAAYGERVGSIHIKDRIRGGTTVPLGEGDADLPVLFRELARIGYDGDLVLQVARGKDGEEVAHAIGNREYVERELAAAAR